MKTVEKFVRKTFKKLYDRGSAKVMLKAVIVDPKSQDYKNLSQSFETGEFGTYTLNPETQGLDFSRRKIFIPDLSEFVGKSFYEIMQHIMATYGDTHYIPGIEYWEWLYKNQNEIPEDLWDNEYYFLSGSVLRDIDGGWLVPCLYWCGPPVKLPRWIQILKGFNWRRGLLLLKMDWRQVGNVVLLEK